MTHRDRLPQEPHTIGWHVVVSSELQIDMLRLLLQKHPGTDPVMLHAQGKMRRLKFGLESSERIGKTLASIFGVENIRYGGGFQEFELRTK